ncbi:MAG: alpha/beta hydrolase [Kutzneria sp.]|nr:alpha/beta hydrolase [Kutzneria sp.]
MTLQLTASPPSPRRVAFEVNAEGLGRYDIQISLPDGYADSEERYPAMYVLDGNMFFDTVHALVNGTGGQLGSLMPRCVVVGVGYPADEGAASFYARRNHNFYGPWDMADQVGQVLHTVFDQLKDAEARSDLAISAGGAPRFMEFLRDELQPALAERFRIDEAARHMLIGNSSGGHFVLRAMFDPNSPFRRYVAISPAFGCARGSIEQLESAYAAHYDDLDAEVFLCAGSRETDNAAHALARAASGVCWLREQFSIRGYPRARIAAEIMPGEHHGLLTARALGRALNFLFGQDAVVEQAMADLTVRHSSQRP